MRIIKFNIFLIAIALTITACTSETDSQQNVIQDKIYSDQFGAMNKARQVNTIVIDGAEQRKKAIESQTGN